MKRNTSFDRLIDETVWIGYYFHAEKNASQKLKDYAKTIQPKKELCSNTYDFSDGTACIKSIKTIIAACKILTVSTPKQYQSCVWNLKIR